MGLDMYLTKRRYVKNWEHMKPEEKHQIVVKKNNKVIDEDMPVQEIVYEAGYWRKANAIHKWFVDNTQDGEDSNGRDSWVSREQLEELLKLCRKVVKTAVVKKGKVQNGSRSTDKGWEPIMEDGEYIENDEEIAAILPAQDGFFFGSTNYDQWYLQSVKDTIEILERALKSDDGDFYYTSSW